MMLLLAVALAAPDYVVVDVRTRDVIERHWADADTAIPMGSLVKPFVAMAYSGPFPEFTCKGIGCWRAHGRLRFREALAQSCNAYFLNLAHEQGTLPVITAKFGINAPNVDTAEARIGLGSAWKISPIALAWAYAELASRRGEPRVAEILAGLALAAETGTARAIGRGAMAKTGTAPCVDGHRDAGDGFTVVLDPADAPRVALLVRVHGVPGAEASKAAARILRGIRK
jgi:cell division protein FtsI/penicillin-binding protein 2